MNTDERAIDVRDLTVSYGEVLALDGASITVDTGAITGLVGVNGSGKSTLFKSILGLVVPSAGHVLVAGTTPARARRAGLVAYLPQHDEGDPSFPVTVHDVVMMGRYGHQGFTRRVRPIDREAVESALERTDMTALAKRQIGELSGGQRKRMFIARAIAQEATVLLLDEPFSGVDRRSEEGITALLRTLAGDGCGVLISTHDLASLPELCDDVVLWMRGQIARGAPEAVLTPENLARAFVMSENGASR